MVVYLEAANKDLVQMQNNNKELKKENDRLSARV